MCKHEESTRGEKKTEGSLLVVGIVYLPHVWALCLVLWHLLQIHTRFVGGGFETAAVEEAAADEESMPNDEKAPTRTADENATPEEERGGSGCGQISSCTFSCQYWRMWLYKYHCLSKERPGGETVGGSWLEDGVQVLSINSEICSLSESDSNLTSTEPSTDAEIEK